MLLARVTWVDADSINGWIPDSEVPEDITPAPAVGYLVRDTKDWVILSFQKNNEDWQSLFRIPKGMVKKVEILDNDE